ncbi:hypothetical protein GGI05_007521, partial [Coemansia sp. RSA 2603]
MGRSRRRGLRNMPGGVRRVLSKLQNPRRRLSADLGRLHTCVSHALSAEMARIREQPAAMPNGPATM